jgi:hypothetical protein
MPLRRLSPAAAFAVVALCLAACGGGGGDPVQPGKPPVTSEPGVPATIVVVAGDGQQGPLASVLPVRPSVLVKDAQGTALSGVAVQFSVDSGGGSVSVSTAATGSNGVAVGGDWTLGASIGTHVLSARVGALAPVRFHAQAMGALAVPLFTQTTISPNGGTLLYRKAGDALDGLTITVRPGAYPTLTTWTISADTTTKIALPQDFTQVGPVFEIDNQQGYADSLVTLTMPLTGRNAVSATEVIAPFYYDPESHKLEAIPVVDRTANSVTLATSHFSRDLLALPRNGQELSALRSQMSVTFGSVKMVWVKSPKEKLVGAFDSGFRPGTDNWEFENWGDYLSPNGICEGMSVSAMYYYYFLRANGAPALYHQFDESLDNLIDNVQGLRYAGSMQYDYASRFHAGYRQRADLDNLATLHGVQAYELTSTWLLLTLKLTQQPVLLALYRVGGAHAVVAYSADYNGTNTNVRFADPNAPKLTRVMQFQSGNLVPIAMANKAGASTSDYTKAYAMSASSDVPLAQMGRRYAQFTAKKAGGADYPANDYIEYLSDLTDAWERVTGGAINATTEHTYVRHICPGCPNKRLTSPPVTDWQPIHIWDAAGKTEVSGADITNVEGTKKYIALLTAYSPVPSEANADGILDAVPFSITYSPVSLNTPSADAFVGEPVALTASFGTLVGIGYTYTWTTSDNEAPVTTTVPQLTYTRLRPGRVNLKVVLNDRNGTPVAAARGSKFIQVKPSISPSPAFAARAKPVTFTLTVPVAIPANMTPRVSYHWTIWKNGNLLEVPETTVPTLQYTFADAGTYRLDANIYYAVPDSQPAILGHIEQVPVTVVNGFPTWKFTSFSVAVDQGGPTPWIDNFSVVRFEFFYADTLFRAIRDGLRYGGLMYVPRDTTFSEGAFSQYTSLKKRGLYVLDSPDPITVANVSQYLAVPQETGWFGAAPSYQVRGTWIVDNAGTTRTADVPALNENYLETGNIENGGSGSIASTYWRWQYGTSNLQQGTLWWPFSIRQANVTFNGTTASGTITYIARDFDHTTGASLPKPQTRRWSITVTFTAERIN